MAEKVWGHHYSERRYILSVLDASGVQIFHIDGEEVFENGIDNMTDDERRKWLEDNYSAEIEDIMESRA